MKAHSRTREQAPPKSRAGGPLLALLLLAGAAGACAGEDVATPPPRSAAERGAALFDDPRISRNAFNSFSCRTCHDPKEAGRRVPGGSLAGSTKRARFWGGSESELLSSVNACFRYFLSDAEGLSRDDERASALYAYLESLPGDGAPVPFTVVPSIVDLPNGDAARGALVWQSTCASCHGEAHTGRGQLSGIDLRVPEATIEEHVPKGDDVRLIVIEKVRHGGFLGYSGRMPPFSLETLDDGALADVLSYLGLDR